MHEIPELPPETLLEPRIRADIEVVRLQNLYTVAFLQQHQVGNERYGWWLTDDYTATEPDVRFQSR